MLRILIRASLWGSLYCAFGCTSRELAADRSVDKLTLVRKTFRMDVITSGVSDYVVLSDSVFAENDLQFAVLEPRGLSIYSIKKDSLLEFDSLGSSYPDEPLFYMGFDNYCYKVGNSYRGLLNGVPFRRSVLYLEEGQQLAPDKPLVMFQNGNIFMYLYDIRNQKSRRYYMDRYPFNILDYNGELQVVQVKFPRIYSNEAIPVEHLISYDGQRVVVSMNACDSVFFIDSNGAIEVWPFPKLIKPEMYEVTSSTDMKEQVAVRMKNKTDAAFYGPAFVTSTGLVRLFYQPVVADGKVVAKEIFVLHQRSKNGPIVWSSAGVYKMADLYRWFCVQDKLYTVRWALHPTSRRLLIEEYELVFH